MTDSYKVRTSQLPNFRDENMKRNEKQENFFSPSKTYSIPSLSFIARSNFSSNSVRQIENQRYDAAWIANIQKI